MLQAIEDLEPVRRGVYCGAIGWIDTSTATTRADLAVAIRTFTVLGAGAAHARLGVGAGIVADSDPTPSGPRPSSRPPGCSARRRTPAADVRARGRSRAATGEPRQRRWSGSTARCVAADDARISPFDHGLLVGDGVFETLRVYDGVPFAWRRHLDRLAHSAAGLGLPVPDRDALRAAAGAVLAANDLRRGAPAHHGHRRRRAARLRARRRAADGHRRGQRAARRGPTADVVTVPWPRNERGATAGLKTISYAENVRALAYAHERGAGEAIFANTRDELCEATGSNVFVVRDGVVRTPPGSSGCLLGVTRALVLELAAASGIAADEPPLPLDALRRRRRGVPHVDHPRGAADRPRRRPRRSRRARPASPPRLAAAFTALVARDLDP